MANTIYHRDSNSLECIECFGIMELQRATANDPERLTSMCEGFEILHGKCHEYKDAHKAQQAIQYLSERKLQKLLAERQKANFVLGLATR